MSAPGDLELLQLRAGVDFCVGDQAATQMANYVYAVLEPRRHEALLVDPAWAPSELVDRLEAADYRLVGAVLTHYHADHAGGSLGRLEVPGVAELLERCAVPIHVQRDELAWLEAASGLERSVFTAHDDADVLSVGEGALRLVHTPGHTPGSQCVLIGHRALTGDTLFLDGCGRTDLPGGDASELHHTLTRRIAAWEDSTAIYPGHAYSPVPSAPLGMLRATNPVLAPLGEADWAARFTG
ncbi:MAG: MBL fold metallo-hydrolase [Actinomycetota bacterium]|nr:MBL fold metallo-hydrolase [Actinomycetota bacterium]